MTIVHTSLFNFSASGVLRQTLPCSDEYEFTVKKVFRRKVPLTCKCGCKCNHNGYNYARKKGFGKIRIGKYACPICGESYEEDKGFWKELILAILIIIITTGIVLTVGIKFIYNDYYNPPLHQAQTDISPFGNEEYLERERIAEAAETIEDCEKIENELWRSYCYSHLARKLDEPSLCDRITVESDTKMLFFSKDLCLINTAKKVKIVKK